MIGRRNRAGEGDDPDRSPEPASDQTPESERAGEPSRETADLLAEIERLKEERDRFLRVAADADNRAKIARREVQESYRQGVTSIARDTILCLDAFDMALAQDMGAASIESVLAGVRSIRAELIRVLTRHGVMLIEPAPADELDPNRHQAMLEQPSDAVPPGRILSLVQAGYLLDDRVIRPAKVIVARPADPNRSDNPTEEDNTAHEMDRGENPRQSAGDQE